MILHMIDSLNRGTILQLLLQKRLRQIVFFFFFLYCVQFLRTRLITVLLVLHIFHWVVQVYPLLSLPRNIAIFYQTASIH